MTPTVRPIRFRWSSISPLKETKLGVGHFWGLEVHYENQKGERVALETYTGYGYRRKG